MMQFLKEIFLPEKIKNYYLFSARVAGIEITKDEIVTTVIYMSGATIKIESCFKRELPAADTYQQRVSLALASIAQELPTKHVVCALESGQIFFKRLQLPFTDYDKLKMVIQFEIQPLLPFSHQDAAIDFVVTSRSAQGSELFVTAVQRNLIQEEIVRLEEATLKPRSVVPDMIALYTLFNTYYNAPSEQTIVLMDIDAYRTRLVYTFDKQILFIRTLPKGFLDIAKGAAKTTGAGTQQVMEHLHRFGFERNSDYATEQALKQQLDRFLSEISFTLTSFTTQTPVKVSQVHKIILSGEGSLFKGIETAITSHLHITAEKFKCADVLLAHNVVIDAATSIDDSYAVSIGAALMPSMQPDYNLAPELVQQTKTQITWYTLITTFILSLCIIATVTVTHYMQSRSFDNQNEEISLELIDALKKVPGVTETEDEADNDSETRLQTLLTKASTRIKEREKLVNEFSNLNKRSLLHYLYEFAQLDKNALGLTIEELIISQERIIFKGNVKTFAAATALRQALRDSEFFGEPTPSAELDKTSFTVQIPILNSRSGVRS